MPDAFASRREPLLVVLAAVHGLVLLVAPGATVIAAGLWWNNNTVSHNFVHRPFFETRGANRAFSLYLTLLLGIPQAVWTQRHLAHHAGARRRLRFDTQVFAECACVLGLWSVVATVDPRFFATAYLPGYAAGLVLCALHGYFEHAPETTSHYGRLYNLLFFNDGYHVEHHRSPGARWSTLPRSQRGERSSRWPAPLRFLEFLSLEGLERLVLRSRWLQSFVLDRHRRAFRALLAELPPVDRACVVGGGLYPRTVLLLRELLPAARLRVVDASESNLRTAERFLERSTSGTPSGVGVEMLHRRYEPHLDDDVALLVVPLAFEGDREGFYRRSAGPAVLVHDWAWRRRRSGRLLSLLLLKRLNLVRP